jgi:hypothetical protein
LQSLAAKALNFKIKNSQNWVGVDSSTRADHSASTSSLTSLLNSKSSENPKESENIAASKLSLVNYNRLLRQYKFLKSTNIKLNNKTDDKTRHLLFLNQLVSDQILHDSLNNTDANNKKKKTIQTFLDDAEDDEDDEQEIFNNKMLLLKPNEKAEQMDHQEGIAEGSALFLTAEVNDDTVKKDDVKDNETNDVDMDFQNNFNNPGTSKSFMNDVGSSQIGSNDQGQQSSNLFTALKFWMSKRVDSLSTSSSPNKALSLDKKDSINKEIPFFEETIHELSKNFDSIENEKISNRKSKKKLKTIKSM